MITGLGHVNLRTPDLEKSLDFYAKLGFKVDSIDHWERENGTAHIAIISNGTCIMEVSQPADMSMLDGLKAGFFGHLCLSVDDLAKTVDELKAQGIAFVQDEIQTLPLFGGIRNINIIGPSGEELELYENI
nr:VOC family protein [Maliibacterium massiliense]